MRKDKTIETSSARRRNNGKLRKSGRALYVGGEAFYLSFVFLWKCSFWLICRPWYMFAYFGFIPRPTIYIPSLKHAQMAGRMLWVSCSSKNIQKCARICMMSPLFTVQIALHYPKGWLTRQAYYCRYLVMSKVSRWLAMVKRNIWGRYMRKSRTKWRLSSARDSGSDVDTITELRGNLRHSQSVHHLDLNNKDEFYILALHNKKFKLYSKLPLRTISRLWGKFVHLPFPDWFRVAGFKFYIWLYGCNFYEAQQQDLKQYKTLGEFFRRKLRPELRPIHGTFPLVSPCDGTVLHFGEIKDGLLEQVKGVTYSLRSFVGPLPNMGFQYGHQHVDHVNCFDQVISNSNANANGLARSQSDVRFNEFQKENMHINKIYEDQLILNSGNKLYYCVIYLAPGDYHCFHSPADWTVYGRRHFSGQLFSVKPSIASWLQGLFCVNERVMYTGRWRYGFFSMTPVGALNVGSINVFFDEKLKTNRKDVTTMGQFSDVTFKTPQQKGVRLNRGELFGDFNLGSTIVLMFEAPANFKLHLKQGRKVKYGQGVGERVKQY